MKKKLLIFVFLLVFGLGAVFTAIPSFVAFAETTENFIIRGYGDSISAGYGLADVEKSYPSVFSQDYISAFQGEFQAKGVSGDTTSDLLEDLTPYINGTAEDMAEFENTDIVTLCIGGNNVLGPAMASISEYMSETLSDADYRVLLEAGVTQFKTEFPQILEAFEGKKVLVMTIYNPFKHTSLFDMKIDSSLAIMGNYVNTVLSTYETQFQKMLATTMEYLTQINNEIRSYAGDDVTVVDIWNLFDGFTKQEYLNYINADLSLVTIAMSDITGGTLMTKISANCDPHPTEAGHAVIAQEHSDNFKYFNLSANKDFSQLKNATDSITFTVNTIESGNYTYKLYKENSLGKTLLGQQSTKTFEIEAQSINGQGTIYFEVYEGSELISTSNSLSYSVSLNTFSISTTSTLSGIKDKGENITLNLNATSTENYTFKLMKDIAGRKTVLAQGTQVEFAVKVDDLVGTGKLYVEVYSNNLLVFTTNKLDFNITLNSFELSSSIPLSNIIFDIVDTVDFTITAKNGEGYSYKLYKQTTTKNLLAEGDNTRFTVDGQNLLGNGTVYVEVYKNSNKIYTSNSISFSASMNDFEIGSDDKLYGVVAGDKVISVEVTSSKNDSYTYKLYKIIDTTESFVKDIEGAGQLFVKIYKGQNLVGTTSSLSYDFTIGVFKLASPTDLETVEGEEEIIEINVNSSAIPQPQYKLIKETGSTKTTMQTNATGLFSVRAKELAGQSRLYVEVYSEGELVATTNTLFFDFDFDAESSKGDTSKFDNLLLIGSIVLAGILAFVGVVAVMVRLSKRNSF